MGNCLFCGKAAQSHEDVIPIWLQKRLGSGHSLRLPDNTLMAYRHAKVPACTLHNNRIFGPLEKRVSEGIATELDVYVWAFKVHAGLLRMDQTVLRGLEKSEDINRQIDLFRKVVLVWEQGGTFLPSPPGSVFVLPALTDKTDWCHSPLGFVGITAKDRYYMVCLFDAGFAKTAGEIENWSAGKSTSDEALLMQRHVIARMAYTVARSRLTPQAEIQLRPPSLTIHPPQFPSQLPPWDKTEFNSVASTFGFQERTDSGASYVEVIHPVPRYP